MHPDEGCRRHRLGRSASRCFPVVEKSSQVRASPGAYVEFVSIGRANVDHLIMTRKRAAPVPCA
ncbi:hypothetical protein ACFPRL_14540 [Pseudoclavibacter helvolus]